MKLRCENDERTDYLSKSVSLRYFHPSLYQNASDWVFVTEQGTSHSNDVRYLFFNFSLRTKMNLANRIFITASKRSLAQGNVFTNICQSFCSQRNCRSLHDVTSGRLVPRPFWGV